MRRTKVLAILMVLILMLCLLPSTALADPEKATDEPKTAAEEPDGGGAVADDDAAVPETSEEEEAEPETDAEETAEPEDGEDAAEEDEDEPEEDEDEPEEDEDEPEEDEEGPATVWEDEIFYAAAEDLVYNNGGTVYNNGGLVYNNGGLVYNNGGTVYNNGGIVYSNDGTVYNNGGTVYRNNAQVYTFDGEIQDARVYGFYTLSFEEDYSAFADLEGLTEEGYLSRETGCVIIPHEGFRIVEAETDSGLLTENEDGSYTLSEPDRDVTLRLVFQADAPSFDLEEGTYVESQVLTIKAPEGTQIYYTTDGSEPDAENGTLYEEPLSLTEGVTVTAVALAEGAKPSELCSADFAFLEITAPSFADVTAGYTTTPAAAAFTVKNPGSVDGEVLSVSLGGKNADSFTLNSESGAIVKAGKTNNSSWTIRPKGGLAAGTYKATVTFTLSSGETAELKVTFKVN